MSRLWSKVAVGLFVMMFLFAVFGLAAGDASSIAATACFLPSLLIVGYLLATKESEMFHPLVFVFLTIFFGITVQTLFLLYLDDGTHRFAIGVVTEPDTILVAIAAVTLGTVFLLLGTGVARTSRSSRPKVNIWVLSRVRFSIVLFLVIGLISLIYYISVFDILENLRSQFSVKRRFVDADTGIVSTFGWIRLGVNFTQLGFIVGYVAYLRSDRRSGFLRLLVYVSATAGVILPFLASSRLGLLTFLLSAAMIHHFCGKRWTVGRLSTIGVVVLCILLIMGVFRYTQSRGLSYSDYQSSVTAEKMLEPIIGSSSFLAVGKTAVVIESVPRLIDYQNGQTYLLWLIAPIPRAWWPEKPVIRIGGVLGEAIFGTRSTVGVPPGIIGELYLNFGWLGIPIGMFLYGVFIAKFYSRYGKQAYSSVNHCVIYCSVVVFIAFTGLSADFTGMVSMSLQRLIPLYLVIKYVGRGRRVYDQED